MSRDVLLSGWLNTVLTNTDYTLKPLTGDASFRRYMRMYVHDGEAGTDGSTNNQASAPAQASSFMVMDAPPDKEKVDSFIAVAEFLATRQVRVPKIVAKDETQGFLLLEDFGDELLSNHLLEHTVHDMYRVAMQQIVHMQQIDLTEAADVRLPHYDAALLEREMDLFSEWFLPYFDVQMTDTKQTLWQQTKQTIITAVLAQPQVFVHRDYHSRNLMVLSNTHEGKPGEHFGVIDFQDAVIGAHTYDLVSIIRDAYVSWPRAHVRDWITEFWHMQKNAGVTTAASAEDFEAQVDIMGVQRQLKVLGIFVRLAKRDGKMGYLDNLTQVMAYLLDECARLGQLCEFNDWLTSDILPKFIAASPDERAELAEFLT